MATRKIVCLGGGIGTVNLIKGLKNYTDEITVVSSIADSGGSSGRLRRVYNMPPPGDIISCMAAIGNPNDEYISEFLTYRFPGDRYGQDNSLEGQKLGNLIIASIFAKTQDFDKSIKILQKMLNISGSFLPATIDQVDISAKLKSGQIIEGEEAIDLGNYEGKKEIDEVYLTPIDAKVNPNVISAIDEADAVVVGPGDLYSNELPVLIVDGISEALKKTKAKKILVVNVANKPAETEGYSVSDFFDAFNKHMDGFPFEVVLVNNNYSISIPKKYDYEYVTDFGHSKFSNINIIKEDLLDENFPLYHDPSKLAKILIENI